MSRHGCPVKGRIVSVDCELAQPTERVKSAKHEAEQADVDEDDRGQCPEDEAQKEPDHWLFAAFGVVCQEYAGAPQFGFFETLPVAFAAKPPVVPIPDHCCAV